MGGGECSPRCPPGTQNTPPGAPPPITGGSTLKSHNLAPPHFRGEHSKISERNSPPPFPQKTPKIFRIPPGYPKIFCALRAKKCLKTKFVTLKIAKFSLRFARKRYQKPQFTLENRKNFLRASREKMLKYHFYLLKNTQNPVQLYICSKHKEFVVNFFFKL